MVSCVSQRSVIILLRLLLVYMLHAWRDTKEVLKIELRTSLDEAVA